MQEELCTCYHRQQHEMRTSGDATRAGDKRQVAEEQQVTENSVYCIMFQPEHELRCKNLQVDSSQCKITDWMIH